MYKPGDTDFSWTRLTPWRTLLAATFDVPHPPVIRGEVLAERDNPSGDMLAAWLSLRLGIPVRRAASGGPGITDVAVRGRRTAGSQLSRYDGRTATLSKTGEPDRRVALHRRDQAELLAEELRRLDPDDVYAESLAWLFSDARTDDEPGRRHVHADRRGNPGAGGGLRRHRESALRTSVSRTRWRRTRPSRALADAAATEAMDADEGETGVESEQEIANQ